MNPFEMTVLIVAIVMGARVMGNRYKALGRERDEGDALRDDAETDRLHGEVRQLKDRIQVLERIVTDGDRNRGMALEREIEALRDQRIAQRQGEGGQ